jgi:hypothetical protein
VTSDAIFNGQSDCKIDAVQKSFADPREFSVAVLFGCFECEGFDGGFVK